MTTTHTPREWALRRKLRQWAHAAGHNELDMEVVADRMYDLIADEVRTTDRAAILTEAADAVAKLDRHKLGIDADTIKDAWEEGRDAGADLLCRLAAEAPQSCPGYETVPNRCACPCEGCKHNCAAHTEAPTTTKPETEAHPPHHRWYVETLDDLAEEWAPGMRFTDRAEAVARYETISRNRPTWKDGSPVRRRFVRETTTYTVEAEHQPAAGAGRDGGA